MAYAYYKGDCVSCKTGLDDPTCDDTPCKDVCIECLRSAGPCVCHCNKLAIVATPQYSDSPFEWCYCPHPDDHKSVPTTQIILGVAFTWSGETFGAGGAHDNSLLAISKLTCPDNPGLTWVFWRAPVGTNLKCVKDTVGWSLLPIDVDGNYSIISDTFPLVGNDFLLTAFSPAPHEDVDGTFDCDPDRVPAAFLIQVLDNCGNQLLLCPVAFNNSEEVTCSGSCPAIDVAFTGGATCPVGPASLFVNVFITSGGFGCPYSLGMGTLTLELGAYTKSVPFTDLTFGYLFDDIPCLDTPPSVATITASWEFTCAGCVSPIVKCFHYNLDDGTFAFDC